jgi:hypothetical protein
MRFFAAFVAGRFAAAAPARLQPEACRTPALRAVSGGFERFGQRIIARDSRFFRTAKERAPRAADKDDLMDLEALQSSSHDMQTKAPALSSAEPHRGDDSPLISPGFEEAGPLEHPDRRGSSLRDDSRSGSSAFEGAGSLEHPDRRNTLLRGDLHLGLIALAAMPSDERFDHPRHLAVALAVEAGALLERFKWLSDAEAAALDAAARADVGERAIEVLLYAARLASRMGVDVGLAAAERMHVLGMPGDAAAAQTQGNEGAFEDNAAATAPLTASGREGAAEPAAAVAAAALGASAEGPCADVAPPSTHEGGE